MEIGQREAPLTEALRGAWIEHPPEEARRQ